MSDPHGKERKALEWIESRDYYPPEAEECLIAIQSRARATLADTERLTDDEAGRETLEDADLALGRLAPFTGWELQALGQSLTSSRSRAAIKAHRQLLNEVHAEIERREDAGFEDPEATRHVV